MSAHESFAEKFRELLRDIPPEYSLEQWQYLFRQASFLMGMNILEKFPHEVIGPAPGPRGVSAPILADRSTGEPVIQNPGGGTPGQTPGGVPHALPMCTFVCFVLALRPVERR